MMRHCSIRNLIGIVTGYSKKHHPGLGTVSVRIHLIAVIWLIAISASAVTPQDLLQHPPTSYFNDYAQIVSPASVTYLNDTLARYEQETSNQILVTVFSEWPAELVFDDYAQDLFRAAKLGQQGKDNGVLVLVAVKERRMRIHTGRGLEGALPDALCNQIIRNEFAPYFRAGNYDESFRQGLSAIMAAARGEYHGSGKTAAQQTHEANGWFVLVIFILMLLFFVAIVVASFRQGHMQRIRGGSGAGTGGRDATSSSDGGGSSGGDSGFSGGGGDSGGGGASGDL